MSEGRTRGGGSRFLYEPFDAASARIETHERVIAERWAGLERRLVSIETALERLERRLWLVVYGAASMVAGEIAFSLFSKTHM